MSEFKIDSWMTGDANRHITQPFGVRLEAYAAFSKVGHNGIDIGPIAPGVKTEVRAAQDGIVMSVDKHNTTTGYGRHVRINHEGGYITIYAHLESVAVNTGNSVTAGQTIGILGNTGNSTGPHLHFEMRKRIGGGIQATIDPTEFVVPYLDFKQPTGTLVSGWIAKRGITAHGGLAKVNNANYSLRSTPRFIDNKLGTVRAYTMMEATGQVVQRELGGEVYFLTEVKVPESAIEGYTPQNKPPSTVEPPITSGPEPLTGATIDGWGYAPSIIVKNDGYGIIRYTGGVNVRSSAENLNEANKLGLLKGNSRVKINGSSLNNYYPITAQRKDFDGSIKGNVTVTPPPTPPPTPEPPVTPEPPPAPKPADTLKGWVSANYLNPKSKPSWWRNFTGQKTIKTTTRLNLRTETTTGSDTLIGVIKGNAELVSVDWDTERGNHRFVLVTVKRSNVEHINEANAQKML